MRFFKKDIVLNEFPIMFNNSMGTESKHILNLCIGFIED